MSEFVYIVLYEFVYRKNKLCFHIISFFMVYTLLNNECLEDNNEWVILERKNYTLH